MFFKTKEKIQKRKNFFLQRISSFPFFFFFFFFSAESLFSFCTLYQLLLFWEKVSSAPLGSIQISSSRKFHQVYDSQNSEFVLRFRKQLRPKTTEHRPKTKIRNLPKFHRLVKGLASNQGPFDFGLLQSTAEPFSTGHI